MWRRFNRAVRASGDVGIWHETFKIRADEYEAVYGNMPVFGLAAAARPLPAAQKANTAAKPQRNCQGMRHDPLAVCNPPLRDLRASSLIMSNTCRDLSWRHCMRRLRMLTYKS